MANSIDFQLHYVYVADLTWQEQIDERNKKILEGVSESNFYLDEGLLNKKNYLFEEPLKEEVDVWYENNRV